MKKLRKLSKIILLIKNLLFIGSLVLFFINWKLGTGLLLISSIIHVIPFGPNYLLNVITGYLFIWGFIFLFFNWIIGLILILSSFSVAKFRIWANTKNFEYYKNK